MSQAGSRSDLLREARLLWQLAATDRRAASSRLLRALGLLRARWLFRRCQLGHRVNALSHVRVEGGGRIAVGDRAQFWEGMIPVALSCAAGAELVIGARTAFNYGSSIRSAQSVRIGADCMLGSMVQIDDDGPGGPRRIVIGDEVWIGHGAVIQRGVTIGAGSVVGAGCVVDADLPPDSLASGNPMTVVPLVRPGPG